MDLKNKTVFLTGACGLLGKFFAKEILKHNANLVAADINLDKAKEIEAEFVSEGIDANRLLFVQLDITSKESINKAIDSSVAKFGSVDVLINNAYPRHKNYGRKLEDVEYADFCHTLSQHVGGYFLCTQVFSAHFAKKGSGNVISMSSIYGFFPPRFEVYENSDFTMPVEYAAIKAGVINLMKYFAKYYRGKNIRYNCLSPGGVFNNQHPDFVAKYNAYGLNKGMLEQKDLVGTLLYLISDASEYVNGQNIVVDDGFTL